MFFKNILVWGGIFFIFHLSLLLCGGNEIANSILGDVFVLGLCILIIKPSWVFLQRIYAKYPCPVSYFVSIGWIPFLWMFAFFSFIIYEPDLRNLDEQKVKNILFYFVVTNIVLGLLSVAVNFFVQKRKKENPSVASVTVMPAPKRNSKIVSVLLFIILLPFIVQSVIGLITVWL